MFTPSSIATGWRAKFPDLEFVLARNAAAADGDLSGVDVLICFGIAVEDFDSVPRDAAQMDSVAGDRRRSFFALPVAQA